MLMLLLKLLHNFSKWRSSSTFPFSNASSSSTFSSIPGLRLSPRSILLMRLPLQFLFGLLSLSYLSSIQFDCDSTISSSAFILQMDCLISFLFLSRTILQWFVEDNLLFHGVPVLCWDCESRVSSLAEFFFHISVWKIPVLLLLSVATFKVLSRGVSPSRTDTLFPSAELMFRDEVSLCGLLLSCRDSPVSWGLSPTSAAFAVSCGLHQCVWTLMTVRSDPIPGTAASSEALQDVHPRLSQGEVFSLKDCHFFNRLLATDLFKLSVTSWFNFGYKCKFTHFF